MNLLNKLIVLLLMTGLYAPSFAAVDDVELISCSVYSDSEKNGDKKDDKKTEEEEEPDCE
jgi:hypothetical protein